MSDAAVLGHPRQRGQPIQRHDPLYPAGVAGKAPAQARRLRAWPPLSARALARSFCCCNGPKRHRVSCCCWLAVAALRLVELRISRRHQQQLVARGAAKVDEPRFRWMVLLHTAVLIGAALEVVLLQTAFPSAAGCASMFAIFLAANAVRWWVIRTLGDHWNVQVMDSTRLGVVTSGPFRFVRHPNYAAVFAEMLALPLIHTAWITALAGSLAHAGGLAQRLVHGRARALRESGLSRGHGGQAQILARLVLSEKTDYAPATVSRWRCSCCSLPRRACAQTAADGAAGPAFTTVPELAAGFHLSTPRNFRKRARTFASWESRHPQEPFGEVAVAASYLVRGDLPPRRADQRFFPGRKEISPWHRGQAGRRADEQFPRAPWNARARYPESCLKKNPKDPEALFGLTLAAGMESDANAILEKKQLDGLKRMKEANEYAKQLLAQRPDTDDAYVALGSGQLHHRIAKSRLPLCALVWRHSRRQEAGHGTIGQDRRERPLSATLRQDPAGAWPRAGKNKTPWRKNCSSS